MVSECIINAAPRSQILSEAIGGNVGVVHIFVSCRAAVVDVSQQTRKWIGKPVVMRLATACGCWFAIGTT
jgi:hypothetical protein